MSQLIRTTPKRGPFYGLAHLLTVANLSMAFGVFLAWPDYYAVIADPVAIMTGVALPSRPSVFEYPYFLLWLVPLFCVGATYVTKGIEAYPASRFFAAFPTLLTGAAVAWLYSMAQYWG